MANTNLIATKMKTSTHQKGLIICGTDTDVGKTVVSSFFVEGLQAVYWKPIQSGLEENTDTTTVASLLNLSSKRYIPEAYKFKAPVSPHWAAEKENKCINPQNLTLPLSNNFIVIETAGGLMVPITRNWLQIDQLKVWNLPIILVARSGLGTLNHTLLSLEALKQRDIKVNGIVLNGPLHQDNPKTLKEFGRVPILAELPTFDNVNIEVLRKEWKKQNLSVKVKGMFS